MDLLLASVLLAARPPLPALSWLGIAEACQTDTIILAYDWWRAAPSCPVSHPFPFNKGTECCSQEQERINITNACDGLALALDSVCCDGTNKRCPAPEGETRACTAYPGTPTNAPPAAPGALYALLAAGGGDDEVVTVELLSLKKALVDGFEEEVTCEVDPFPGNAQPRFPAAGAVGHHQAVVCGSHPDWEAENTKDMTCFELIRDGKWMEHTLEGLEDIKHPTSASFSLLGVDYMILVHDSVPHEMTVLKFDGNDLAFLKPGLEMGSNCNVKNFGRCIAPYKDTHERAELIFPNCRFWYGQTHHGGNVSMSRVVVTSSPAAASGIQVEIVHSFDPLAGDNGKSALMPNAGRLYERMGLSDEVDNLGYVERTLHMGCSAIKGGTSNADDSSAGVVMAMPAHKLTWGAGQPMEEKVYFYLPDQKDSSAPTNYAPTEPLVKGYFGITYGSVIGADAGGSPGFLYAGGEIPKGSRGSDPSLGLCRGGIATCTKNVFGITVKKNADRPSLPLETEISAPEVARMQAARFLPALMWLPAENGHYRALCPEAGTEEMTTTSEETPQQEVYGQCPSDTPYPFQDGKRCCSTRFEESLDDNKKSPCAGQTLHWLSQCCVETSVDIYCPAYKKHQWECKYSYDGKISAPPASGIEWDYIKAGQKDIVRRKKKK